MFSELFKHSDGTRPPLKVGVMLDGPTLKRCFAEVLDDIQSSNVARLDCVVVRRGQIGVSGPKPGRVRSLISRLTDARRRAHTLYSLYERWDTKQAPADYALADVDCSDRLAGVPTIDVEPLVKGFVHRFPADVIEQLKRRDLDVLLRFGFNILRGDILQVARYGVWSFHHGDNEFYRGGPALFWELWEGNPLSGVVLQKLTEELDAGEVLCKSVFATAQPPSLSANRHGAYSASSHFVMRKLYELHALGPAGLEERRVPDRPYRGRRRLYRTPTNSDMTHWLARRVLSRAARVFKPARERHWKVGLRKGGPFIDEAAIGGSPIDMSGFSWVEAPSGTYYADPCLVEVGGKTHLFVEDFDHGRARGRISVGVLDSEGRAAAFAPCLEEPHHLSFPFVFSYKGEVWMIPESAEACEVVLYRARRFPFDWVREKTLLRGSYVDTVAWHDDAWWLLTTVREPAGYCVHTVLFTADDLTDEWRLHPASPLFNDVRLARNGGAAFQRGQRRFRVSQDCSIEYGRAFEIHEMTEVSGLVYRERSLARVEPVFAPNMIATHTYTRAADVEAIDACFLERPWPKKREVPGRPE